MAALRFEKAEEDRPPRVNFIPLIDIVLQIICFYIFVGAGVKSYQNSTVELPVMTAQPLGGEIPAELIVNIGASGALDVNGREIQAAQLGAQLKNAKARAIEKKQHLVVAIRADRRQRFDLLDRVLQACKDAEVGTISIRALSDPAVARRAGK
jgi:biopolymer transport protein ExbD